MKYLNYSVLFSIMSCLYLTFAVNLELFSIMPCLYYSVLALTADILLLLG